MDPLSTPLQAADPMARLPIDKALATRTAGRTIARYIDFVYRTSRVVIEPEALDSFLDQHRPAIIAVWHGQFLLAPKVKPLEEPLRIVLARHGDAELYAEALARFNTTLIRGSGAAGRLKNRGGAHALREAIRTLEANTYVALTADVPPGPARRAGDGIISLARMSGRPIIPLAVATSRYRCLNTWSRMTINLPFGKLAGVFGDPIHVPPDADDATLERLRLAVEDGLNATTARAYLLAGADMRRATPSSASSDGRPAAPGLGLKAYSAATRVAQVAAPLLLGARERRGREEPARRGERLGIAGQPRPKGTLIWIHAASVGEINAVLPLAEGLRARNRELTFLFTTGTVTSAAIAAQRMAPGDIHQYIPLDSPAFVRRFLNHWQPDLAVFTESEIWPNLVLETSARSIPLALVNARMSNRSFGRWKRFKGVSQPLMNRFDIVLTQNEKLARRFSEIGARRAIPVGNLKNDSPPPPTNAAILAQLKAAFGERVTLVAASTHDGEDRIVMGAHKAITVEIPSLLTIIAPRHPERGQAILDLAASLGLKAVRRSQGELPGADTEIYIADTIGELGTLYAASPVAFIGGSLVTRGGQNPVEAIRHGTGVLTGPSVHNFADAYRTLFRHGGAIEVGSAQDIADAMIRLTQDGVELARLRAGANDAVSSMSGALERTVEELLAFFPACEGFKRAG